MAKLPARVRSQGHAPMLDFSAYESIGTCILGIPMKLLSEYRLLVEKLICGQPLTQAEIATYNKLVDYPTLDVMACTGMFGSLDTLLIDSDLDYHTARIALDRAATGDTIFKDIEVLEQLHDAILRAARKSRESENFNTLYRAVKKHIKFPAEREPEEDRNVK